jgi:hypothetical protein
MPKEGTMKPRKTNQKFLFPLILALITTVFFPILSPPAPSPDPERLVGDKLKVVIPKNLSLFHIIVLLTPSAEKMKDRFPHPLAQKAREYFAPYRSHPAVQLADKIFESSWYFPFNYLTFFFTDVPEAKLRQDIDLPAEAQNPEFKALAFDFIEKAKDFYAAARFEEFWQSLKGDFEKILDEAAEQLQGDIPAPFDPHVRYPKIDFPSILDSFFGWGAERYYFVPCIFMPFTATHAEVQAKTGGPSYFYLQGGGLLPKTIYTYNFAIHEFSHCFLGPISEKYAKEIDDLKDLYLPLKATFPSKGYRTWSRAFDEHLNEAIQLWLIRKAFGDEAMNYFKTHELDKDFKLIDYFFAAVRDYDQHRDIYKDMEAYYPEMLRQLSRLKVEPYRRPDRMGFDMGAQEGCVLIKAVVPGMAFDKAGIRGGDIVVSVGPDAVHSVDTFNAAKAKRWNTVKEGESCNVTILRAGKRIELKVAVPFIDDFRYAEVTK